MSIITKKSKHLKKLKKLQMKPSEMRIRKMERNSTIAKIQLKALALVYYELTRYLKVRARTKKRN